jgi:hypothetical protein
LPLSGFSDTLSKPQFAPAEFSNPLRVSVTCRHSQLPEGDI